MAELEAVLDAPELDVIDPQPEAAETDHVDDTPNDGEPTADVAGDGRKIPQYIRNMKESDPIGYKAAKDLFFGKQALEDKYKDFDVDAFKSKVEPYGDVDGLLSQFQEREQKSQAMDNIQAMVDAGDPAIIQTLAGSVAPEAFGRMAQATMAEWAKIDQPGYSAAVYGALAGVVSSGSTQSLYGEEKISIPTLLAEARSALRYAPVDQQGAVANAVMSRIEQFLGSFGQMASQPVTRQQTTPQPNVNQERQAWEQEKFTDGLNGEEQKQRDPLMTSELASFVSKRPNDAEAKELAFNTLKTQVAERMAADKDYQAKRAAFIARKDKDGALKLAKSRESAVIKEIAPKVGRAIYGNAVAPVVVKPTVRVAPRIPSKPADAFDAIYSR